MISQIDLNEFYQDRVYPKLEGLEAERIIIVAKLKKIRSLLIWSVLIGTIAAGNLGSSPAMGAAVVMFGVIVLIPFYFILSYKIKKPFYKVFKKRVVEPMLKQMGRYVIFEEENYIQSEVIEKAALFKSFSSIHGDDYVKGRFHDVDMEFSQVHITKIVEKKIRHRQQGSDSMDNTTYISLLDGLLFVIDTKLSVDEGFALIAKSSLDLNDVLGVGLGTVAKGMLKVSQHFVKEDIDPLVQESGDKAFDDRFELRGSKKDVDTFLTPQIRALLLDIVGKGQLIVGLRDRKLYFGVGSAISFEGKISQSLKEYKEPLELMGHIKNAVTLAQSFDVPKEEMTMEW